MRRASEMPFVKDIVQVGTRGPSSGGDVEVRDARAWGAKIFTGEDLFDRGIQPVIDAIRPGTNVHVNFDLDGLDPILARTAVRMIHACGMVDLVADVAASPGFGRAAIASLKAGAPVLCDTQMVAAGVTRSRLPAGDRLEQHPSIAEPSVGVFVARGFRIDPPASSNR